MNVFSNHIFLMKDANCLWVAYSGHDQYSYYKDNAALRALINKNKSPL